MRIRLLALALFVLSCTAAQARQSVQDLHGYTGNAYDRAGKLLYREQHLIWTRDGQARRLVVYRCPGGSAFARKHLRVVDDPDTPDFRLRDSANGQQVQARRSAGGIALDFRAGSGATMHEKQLPLPAQAIIDAGFNAYVQQHWGALLTGKTRKVRFLVPSRREWMGFTVQRVDNAKAVPAGSVTFRLKLGDWFAFLLPHVDVRYRLADHHLLDYRGPSNLSDERGDNPWVDIVFPADQVHKVLSAQTLARAETAPLDGHCTL